jgi:hypothetical protein
VERRKKRRAVVLQVIENRLLSLADVVRGRGAPEARQVIGEVERDAPVAVADRLDAAPHDFP